MNVPNERNQNYASDGLDVNGKNGYSFNQMNIMFISMNNRFEEHIIKQDSLIEWFRKAVERMENTTDELKNLNKKQQDLNNEIFNWLRNPYHRIYY